ncbi:MAG: replication initiator protein [Microvirus sp.]|nr:MAG: replication initiator protein [Microvirus sp.]
MCISPIHLKLKEAEVPCGKCPHCISRKVSAWSFRLMQETKYSTTAYFITLTYDEKNLRYKDLTTRPTLFKRDIQLFIKRLRKTHTDPRPIKYYAVGEYGEKTWRPHYHIIIFNAAMQKIQPAWNLGQIHYGTVTEASVGYTLKYITKQKPTKYALRNRNQQFTLQSKGLGKEYLTKGMVSWHKKEIPTRAYCNLTDGKKITMPRYYKEKIYTPEDRKAIQIASSLLRDKQRKQFNANFNVNYHNLTAAVENYRNNIIYNLKISKL